MSARMTRSTLGRWLLCTLLMIFSLQACSSQAESAAKKWSTECVGRMQFQLPGYVYPAATFNSKVSSFRIGSAIEKPTFPDGTPAHLANSYLVSHPLTADEKKKFIEFALAEGTEVTGTSPSGEKVFRFRRGFTESRTSDGGVIRRYPGSIWGTIFVGDNLIRFGPSIEVAERLLKAVPRPVFDVPKVPGLCMPYVFVPDDGMPTRNLSMSYRLKDHPDIQVTLTDASAFKPEQLLSMGGMSDAEVKLRNKNAEPESEIAGFWHIALNEARKYESLWLLPTTTKPVTLAGYEGRQSFVRLTMDDGSQNYGYYAVVRGNPKAAEDVPDIRLHVLQDVRLAQDKTPLNQDQFIEMAQAIAKSVQRRPTVAQ